MATIITEDCIRCGACLSECPTGAIAEGEPVFVIDPDRCVECASFHNHLACAEVCPVDVCVITETSAETEEQLRRKLQRLFPERSFLDLAPSHLAGG